MKKFVSMIMAVVLLASLSAPALAAGSLSNFQRVNDYTPGQFTDVPAGSWCADNVGVVYGYGLMNGKSDTHFEPDGSVTAAQALVIACRLHQIYHGGDGTFAAPAEGEDWYAPQMAYALENGIVSGPLTAPNVPATRLVFAQLLSAALPDAALNAVNSVEDGAIPDVTAGSAGYDAVYRLYRAGVLTGSDDQGTFYPDSNITRGAAAAIVGRMADPSLRRSLALKKPPFQPVPISKLDNLAGFRKRMSESELAQAYAVAVDVVTPLADMSREDQLYGIAVALRQMFESGMSYSTDTPHYNDPYGYFILKTASCAGCTRATGLCLNALGIPYEHVNENQWSHQWCRVKMPDSSYWITDAYGLYCGPEPAPYAHPYF